VLFRSAADFVRYVTKNLNRIHPPHSGNVRRPIPPNQRMPAFRGAFQGGIERGIYEVERGKHLVERPFSIFRERKNEWPPFADSTVGARPAVTKIQILDHARHPPRGILAAVLDHPSPRSQRRIEHLACIPRPIIPRGNSRPFSVAATGGQVRPRNEGSKAWTPNYRG
jgi:hypothetical protein